MPEHDFEQHLARRLRQYSEDGVRPYDAIDIARAAMAGGHGAAAGTASRGGLPVWFRSLVLAGLLVVLLVATAFVGGLIRLPTGIVEPSPTVTPLASPTIIAGPTPTMFPTLPPTPEPIGSPTIEPTASPSPTTSPSPPVSPSPSPSPSPTASPSPSPSPSPTPTLATGWREIAFPGNAQRTNVLSVAERGGRYVAVGAAGGSYRVWVSDDGQRWSRAQAADGVVAHLVVATDSGFFAFRPSSTGQVWRSTDGQSWTSMPAAPDGFVADAAYHNGLMVAVGSDADFDQAGVWTSTDGMSWTVVTPPAGASHLTGVAMRAGNIVVIGDSGAEGHGRRLYFLPAGGSSWQGVEPFGEDVDGRLVDIADNGSRFVAVGYRDDPDTGRRSAIAMSSANGTNWARTIVSDRDPLVFDQIETLPDGRFLAVASETLFAIADPSAEVSIFETGLAYVSPDGTSWRAVDQIYERGQQVPPEIGDQVERVRAVAAGQSGVVIFDYWDYDRLHVFFGPIGIFR